MKSIADCFTLGIAIGFSVIVIVTVIGIVMTALSHAIDDIEETDG
jgi:galactitol-specific phosphotransferase system IIC component